MAYKFLNLKTSPYDDKIIAVDSIALVESYVMGSAKITLKENDDSGNQIVIYTYEQYEDIKRLINEK